MLKPEGMKRAMFTSGGSGLRRERAAHRAAILESARKSDKTKFMALKKGYHGTHFGGASVNGNSNFRRAYEPLLPGVYHAPAPYLYRNPFNETDPARLVDLCIAAIDDEIRFQGRHDRRLHRRARARRGRRDRAARRFLHKLRALLDSHDILMIADEVITGFGRTGKWFGVRNDGFRPDIMCIAKAITSGYFPLGACVVNEKIEEAFMTSNDALAAIYHGYTYSGHPSAAPPRSPASTKPSRATCRAMQPTRARSSCRRTGSSPKANETIGDVRGKG